MDAEGTLRSLNRTGIWSLIAIVFLGGALIFFDWMGQFKEHYYTYAAAAGTSIFAVLAVIVGVDAIKVTLKQSLQRSAGHMDRRELVVAIKKLIDEAEENESIRRELLRALHRSAKSEQG